MNTRDNLERASRKRLQYAQMLNLTIERRFNNSLTEWNRDVQSIRQRHIQGTEDAMNEFRKLRKSTGHFQYGIKPTSTAEDTEDIAKLHSETTPWSYFVGGSIDTWGRRLKPVDQLRRELRPVTATCAGERKRVGTARGTLRRPQTTGPSIGRRFASDLDGCGNDGNDKDDDEDDDDDDDTKKINERKEGNHQRPKSEKKVTYGVSDADDKNNPNLPKVTPNRDRVSVNSKSQLGSRNLHVPETIIPPRPRVVFDTEDIIRQLDIPLERDLTQDAVLRQLHRGKPIRPQYPRIPTYMRHRKEDEFMSKRYQQLQRELLVGSGQGAPDNPDDKTIKMVFCKSNRQRLMQALVEYNTSKTQREKRQVTQTGIQGRVNDFLKRLDKFIKQNSESDIIIIPHDI